MNPEDVKCEPMGKWIENQGTDKRANLFWARALTGIGPDALEAIHAKQSAATLDCLPTPEDDKSSVYAGFLVSMNSKTPIIKFVSKTYEDELGEAADRIEKVLSSRPSDESMAKLLLLALHSDAKSQWNTVMPKSEWINASTMFSATDELDALNSAVLSKVSDPTSDTTRSMLGDLLMC
jgi:hypothetical protein